MNLTDFNSARGIKLNQKKIEAFLALLASGTFTSTELEQMYNLLEDDYDEFIGRIYTVTPTISFVGGGGAGAAGEAVLEDGILASITITDGGTGYTSEPEIVFSDADGAGAGALSILGSTDTIVGATVVHQSLVARLVSKNWELDDAFAAL